MLIFHFSDVLESCVICKVNSFEFHINGVHVDIIDTLCLQQSIM